MKVKYIIFALAITTVFSACEDIIDLDLEEGQERLVVDAFINSDSATQTIRVTTTAPYFSNVRTPGVSGVEVKVLGPNNQVYNFNGDGKGNYNYNPLTFGALDSIGFNYQLEMKHEGNTFTAVSKLNPVPVIDSMTFAFEEEEINSEAGYYTQFFARDFAGTKDYYWIKPFKNNLPVYANQPALMIISEDAAFGGDAGDGLVFILPLRASITNQDDPFELIDTIANPDRSPDVSRVELHSLNVEAYQFLDQVGATNGNDGLFAVPPSNIRSNIRDAAGNTQDEVLGLFSLSAISRSQITIQ
jgi:hypothetical protein